LIYRYMVVLCITAFILLANDPFKNIEYFKLKNGFQVYMLPDNHAEKTSILISVGVGYGDENDNNFGISHLVEHLIFRDARVPHRDYLDYLTAKGATYVNGQTNRFETYYTATIDSNKSILLVKSFAKMLFDKNITKVDLEAERGALQSEIKEPNKMAIAIWNIANLIKKISPQIWLKDSKEYSETKTARVIQ